MIPEEDEIAVDAERDPHFTKLTLQDEGGNVHLMQGTDGFQKESLPVMHRLLLEVGPA